MSKDYLAKYYQNDKERLLKKLVKNFFNLGARKFHFTKYKKNIFLRKYNNFF